MKFDVQIKNLGKIQEANIKVRPLTLVAGVNSSGKSFFTKSFYSILKALNEDHLTVVFKLALENMVKNLKFIENNLPRQTSQENKSIEEIYMHIQRIMFNANRWQLYIDKVQFMNIFDDDFQALSNLINIFDNKLKSKRTKYNKIREYIDEMKIISNYFLVFIKNPHGIYMERLQEKIKEEIQENFQIRKISDLLNKALPSLEEIQINIKGIVTFLISEKKILPQFEGGKLPPDIKNISKIVFFESPVYWKITDIFEVIKNRTYLFDQYLTGVPKYFYDAANLLKLQPKTDIEFPDLLEKITKAINGKIVLSSTGSFIYKDNNKYEYSLNTTASGISNLGMMGLLIEKNIVTKGSFLIIDEPETNLHPEWQMVLMEVLFELSKRGVNIVFATHSLDMVKCLEVIVQKAISQKEYLTDHIGINLLNDEGKSEELESDLLQQICEVKQTLAEPYALKSMESLKYD